MAKVPPANNDTAAFQVCPVACFQLFSDIFFVLVLYSSVIDVLFIYIGSITWQLFILTICFESIQLKLENY